MKSGIYIITNTLNNKVYVGSGVNLIRRFYYHKTRFRANVHHNQMLQRLWNKYGEKYFRFSIIEYVTNIDKLLIRETIWINYYNSCNREFGYNICKIGRNGYGSKRSPETRLKMSLSQKGRIITKEHRMKISKTLQGNKCASGKRSPESIENIRKGRQKHLQEKMKVVITSIPIII